VEPAGSPYFLDRPAFSGDTLLVGWGGTFGTIKAATLELQKQGMSISACQVRYLNPLPADLGKQLSHFKRVIVCELNLGQLRTLLRAEYLIRPLGINKVQGQPFTIGDIVQGVRETLED